MSTTVPDWPGAEGPPVPSVGLAALPWLDEQYPGRGT